MGINDVTGDKLISKVNSKEFDENYEKIFGKKCIKEGKEEAIKNAEKVKEWKYNFKETTDD